MTNAVQHAYENFRIGSQGFCKYIGERANLNISDEEVRRIAEKAKTAEEFMAIWNNDTYWRDLDA